MLDLIRPTTGRARLFGRDPREHAVALQDRNDSVGGHVGGGGGTSAAPGLQTGRGSQSMVRRDRIEGAQWRLRPVTCPRRGANLRQPRRQRCAAPGCRRSACPPATATCTRLSTC
ncbi:hypothetical protein [Micromonospora peucetia]|uniref:hypothetical protein n=1 Tax=Micromonospora peucetia TaxID=47871 RepID=UPI003EBD2D1C